MQEGAFTSFEIYDLYRTNTRLTNVKKYRIYTNKW